MPGKALGNEHLNWIHHFLSPIIQPIARLPVGEGAEPAEHGLSLGLEWGLILVSVAVAVAGILIARRLWGGERGLQGDEAFAARFPAVQRTLENKYWVDEAYDRWIVRPLAGLARLCWKVIDVLIIDGSVHVGAFVAEITGDLGRLTTTGNVRNYALYFFGGLVLLFCWMIL